ncbi:MAG: response regulator transcription factor [Dehalococcoidia bacterium]|nr:response regulator transcription factor [Dehalococcoidia bacterium]
MPTNVLVVEDDEATSKLMQFLMEEEGFFASVAATAEEARRLLGQVQFDVALLDISLAGEESGVDLCNTLRYDGNNIPVIFVTAKSESTDTVAGLRAGADDYIAKPFDIVELVARVKAVLRRHRHQLRQSPIVGGGLSLDVREAQVTTPEGVHVALTPVELRILRYLLLKSGRTVSRESLLRSALGSANEGENTSVDVYIHRLRKKIEKDPSRPVLLQTVHGVGYKLVT